MKSIIVCINIELQQYKILGQMGVKGAKVEMTCMGYQKCGYISPEFENFYFRFVTAGFVKQAFTNKNILLDINKSL